MNHDDVCNIGQFSQNLILVVSIDTKLCRNANNEFTCPKCHKIISKYPWNAKRHITYCNGKQIHLFGCFYFIL